MHVVEHSETSSYLYYNSHNVTPARCGVCQADPQMCSGQHACQADSRRHAITAHTCTGFRPNQRTYIRTYESTLTLQSIELFSDTLPSRILIWISWYPDSCFCSLILLLSVPWIVFAPRPTHCLFNVYDFCLPFLTVCLITVFIINYLLHIHPTPSNPSLTVRQFRFNIIIVLFHWLSASLTMTI